MGEQQTDRVLTGSVDHALHEVLADGHLVVVDPDAEEPLDERIGRVGVAASTTDRLGDAERLTADHSDGDRVDEPVGQADDGRDCGIEPGFEFELIG